MNYIEFYAGAAEVHKAVASVYPRSAAADILYGTELNNLHATNPHDIMTPAGLASSAQC